MIDFFYKFLRKSLSKSLYGFLTASPVGRADYWRKPDTLFENFNLYNRRIGEPIQDKTILEIGCANQYFTAFCFLEAGAKKVLLAEPRLMNSGAKLEEDFNVFCTTKQHKKLTLESAKRQILCFTDLNQIPLEYNQTVDTVCSHLVLEHFEDLSSYFKNVSRLMCDNGIAYNRVDLSDHTYHIFGKFKITRWLNQRRALFHLRYSKKVFALINDKKCFMNRVLFSDYFEIANGYGFESIVVDKLVLPKAFVKIHPDLITKNTSKDIENTNVILFEIIFRKRP